MFAYLPANYAKPSLTESKPVAAAATTSTPLTITEAVEIAMLNKPNLQTYKYAIEASKARGMQVWSEYLPHVGLMADIGQKNGGDGLQTQITMDAQQLIYSFAGPIEKYKKAKKQTNITQLANDKDKKAIKNAVECAFLECWKVQQQHAFINALHTSSTSTYKKQACANKLKLLDKSDWLKSKSDYAKNLAILDKYYQGIELTQKKLEFFMGQPIDLALTTFEKPSAISNNKQHIVTLALEWKEPKDINILPLTTYYKYATGNKEELKIADQQIGIAKDQIYIAQRSDLPTISAYGASGGFLAEQMGPMSIAPKNFYNCGIRIKWPIFNGLLHDYEEKEAHANMAKEILAKDQLQQDIKLAIETAYHALENALTNLKAKRVDLVYTRNNLALKKQELKIGVISHVELDVAQSEWEHAEYEWLDLMTNAVIKERNLAYACGYPKELD